MDKISDASLEPLPESSPFVRPKRLKYKQDGVSKCWDLLLSRKTVGVVIYNTTRQRLVLVKQFRPAVFVAQATATNAAAAATTSSDPDKSMKQVNESLKDVDPNEHGVTLEICAGIVDKADKSTREIARLEVLEECGYDVPLNDVQEVQSVLGGVGTSGERMYLHYVEVTDGMRVSAGGGLPEEGELIEVTELSVPEVKQIMNQEHVRIPTFTMYALYWFLMNKAPPSPP